MPWPSIKATMSSFSESRLSVLIVKHSFSQMGVGGDSVEIFLGRGGGVVWADWRG